MHTVPSGSTEIPGVVVLDLFIRKWETAAPCQELRFQRQAWIKKDI